MKAKVPSKKLRCHFFFEGLVIFLYTSCLVSQFSHVPFALITVDKTDEGTVLSG